MRIAAVPAYFKLPGGLVAVGAAVPVPLLAVAPGGCGGAALLCAHCFGGRWWAR